MWSKFVVVVVVVIININIFAFELLLSDMEPSHWV